MIEMEQNTKIFSNRILVPNSYIYTEFGNIGIHLIFKANLQFNGQAQFTYKMTNNFDGNELKGTVTIYGEPYLSNQFKKAYDQFSDKLGN